MKILILMAAFTLVALAPAFDAKPTPPQLCSYPPCVYQSVTVDNGNVHATAGERIVGDGLRVDAGTDGIHVTTGIGFSVCHTDVNPDGTVRLNQCYV
jgi:hypothetical protein